MHQGEARSPAGRELEEIEILLRRRGDGELADRVAGVRRELEGSGQPEEAGEIGARASGPAAGLATGPMSDPSPAGAVQPPASVLRALRALDVEKCPRCTLRTLEVDPECLRLAPDGETVEAALWRCGSCGHEVWRRLD